MNKQEIKELANNIKELDMFGMTDFETTIIGRGICFRTTDYEEIEVIEGHYDTLLDKLVFCNVEASESTLFNVKCSMINIIEDFKNHLMNKKFTPLDLQTIDELEEVRLNYELHGDQFLQYVCLILEQRYGKAKVIEFLEEELHTMRMGDR